MSKLFLHNCHIISARSSLLVRVGRTERLVWLQAAAVRTCAVQFLPPGPSLHPELSNHIHNLFFCLESWMLAKSVKTFSTCCVGTVGRREVESKCSLLTNSLCSDSHSYSHNHTHTHTHARTHAHPTRYKTHTHMTIHEVVQMNKKSAVLGNLV